MGDAGENKATAVSVSARPPLPCHIVHMWLQKRSAAVLAQFIVLGFRKSSGNTRINSTWPFKLFELFGYLSVILCVKYCDIDLLGFPRSFSPCPAASMLACICCNFLHAESFCQDEFQLTQTQQDTDVWINNNRNPYKLLLTHIWWSINLVQSDSA